MTVRFTGLKSSLLALAVTGLYGCAGALVPMGDKARDAALKSFQPPVEASALYVYRNEQLGFGIRMDVLVDGVDIGSTGAHTFLYHTVTPGPHRITSKAENIDSIDVDCTPGSVVFVWQEVKMGFNYARTKLRVVGEKEGKAGVLQTNLATR